MTGILRERDRETSDDGCKQGGLIRELIEAIIYNTYKYFDKKGTLNSDGRKAVARILKMSKNDRQRQYLKRVLRMPTYEELLKVYNILFEECIYGD